MFVKGGVGSVLTVGKFAIFWDWVTPRSLPQVTQVRIMEDTADPQLTIQYPLFRILFIVKHLPPWAIF